MKKEGLLDCVQFSLKGKTTKGQEYQEYKCDDEEILRITKSPLIMKITPSGNVSIKSTSNRDISSNGARLTLSKLGKDPDSILKDQEYTNELTQYYYEKQIQLNENGVTQLFLLKDLTSKIVEWASSKCSFTLTKIPFRRLECYKKIITSESDEVFINKAGISLERELGAYERLKIPLIAREKTHDDTTSNRYYFSYEVPLGYSRGKRSFTRLKLYRKQFGWSLELSIFEPKIEQNFKSLIQRVNDFENDKDNEKPENMRFIESFFDALQCLVEDHVLIFLNRMEKAILNKVKVKKYSYREIKERFKKYSFSNLEYDQRFQIIINELANKGYYTPSKFPKKSRLSPSQLKKLTDSVSGILVPENIFGINGGVKKGKVYLLKEDFKAIEPPKSSRKKIEKQIKKMEEL